LPWLFIGDDPDNCVVNLNVPQYLQMQDKFTTETAVLDVLAAQQEAHRIQTELDALQLELAGTGYTQEELVAPQVIPYRPPNIPGGGPAELVTRRIATDTDNDEEIEEMETYILKPGQEHHGFKKAEKEGEPDVRHLYTGEPGNNKVELTEVQFLQLKDKFESAKTQDERRELEKAAADARAQLEEARTKLAEKGINLNDLLESGATPSPTPSSPEQPSYAMDTDPETRLRKEQSYLARGMTAADEKREENEEDGAAPKKASHGSASTDQIAPPDVSGKKK
jgi:hypothetical protein